MIRSAAGLALPRGTIERDTGVALLGAADVGPIVDRARRGDPQARRPYMSDTATFPRGRQAGGGKARSAAVSSPFRLRSRVLASQPPVSESAQHQRGR